MNQENKQEAPQPAASPRGEPNEQQEKKDEPQATAEAQKQDKPKAQEPQKAEEQKPAKKERPDACSKCGKKITRKNRYYRNAKYYCGKSCWKTADTEAQKAKAAEPQKTEAEHPTTPSP